jgi:hypothetical protein
MTQFDGRNMINRNSVANEAEKSTVPTRRQGRPLDVVISTGESEPAEDERGISHTRFGPVKHPNRQHAKNEDLFNFGNRREVS